MNIAVRLEGGLGDVLCANRFVYAIKEKYSDSQITAYIDSEGKTFQKEALEILYPNTYKKIKIIPKKKYKPFYVDCQFGIDNYYGALENVPDNLRKEMETQYDKFYDLHIDSLKWTNFDFDWLRYFYFFPRPKIEFKKEYNEKYVVFHLASNNLANAHRMEDWYIYSLVKKVAEQYKCLIITTEETLPFLKHLSDIRNLEFIYGDLKKVANIINFAACFVCIDSGLKYIAHACSVPTYCFSQQSLKAHMVLPSHKLRWLLYPETNFPLHFDLNYISKIIINTCENPAFNLIPYVDNFDNNAVKRHYTVNIEKSILN
jgi:ADP-heptose:LPS heptosyltransferase